VKKAVPLPMETMNIVGIRKSIKILLQAHEKNFLAHKTKKEV